MEVNEKNIEVIKAFGDSTRFKIITLLSSKKCLCVTALSKFVNISQPTVSQHLKILKNAGIVTSSRAGNHIHYSLRKDSISELQEQFNLLLENEPVGCSMDECLVKKECLEKKKK